MKTILTKLSITTIIVCLIVNIFSVAIAIPVKDDIAGHWSETTLQSWINNGLLRGNNGRYLPNHEITRAEFMALVNRLYGYSEESNSINNYTDASKNSWYFSDIAKAHAAGYIKGNSNNLMSPDSVITREQVFTILARINDHGQTTVNTNILASISDSKSISSWARESVAVSVREGYVTGNKGFINPLSNITRAEAIVLLDRIKSNTRLFAFPGTYDFFEEILTTNDVSIISKSVNLKNMRIHGNLLISENVGNGSIYLENVTVNGSITIKGSGNNSVYLKNVTVLGNIMVTNSDYEITKIIASGNTKLNTVILKTGAILDTQSLTNGSVKEVNISKDFVGKNPIEFTGSFDTIVNISDGAEILMSGAIIAALNLEAKATINGTGKIIRSHISKAAGKGSSMPVKPETLEGDGAADIMIKGEPSESGVVPFFPIIIPGTGGGSQEDNKAPYANAGADIQIYADESAILNGSATDDSLPTGKLIYKWCIVSGPGNVFFDDSTAIITRATFSLAGTYILKLTVSDGSLSSTDTIVITVNPLPVQTKSYNELLAVLPVDNDDNTYTAESWAAFVVAIAKCDLKLTEADGQAALDEEVIKIQEALDLLDEVDPVDQLGLTALYKFDNNALDSSGNENDATLHGSTSYSEGRINNALFLNGNDGYVSLKTGIVGDLTDFTISTWVKANSTDTWSRVFDFGTDTSHYMFLTLYAGSYPRYAITIGGNGSEQVVSGTKPITTGVWHHIAISQLENTATLYINGEAVASNSEMELNPLSLGASNLNYIGRSNYPSDPYFNGLVDDFRIYNKSLSIIEIRELYTSGGGVLINKAPIVNAGSDIAITLPAVASLSGTATDDGLPNGTLTYSWSKVSGPGTVTFANASALNTTATFSSAGTYVLGLTASDTALSSNGTITVTVNATSVGDPYVWSYGNVPGATMQTWEENPNLTPININPYGEPAHTVANGYILINEGVNGPSQVSLINQTSILQRINEDLRFEVETLGIHMPPWATGQTGRKYIDYFFTNTGLPNDPGATGWQGWEGSYPMVATDSAGMNAQNRYNLTHEFNHVLLNSYGTIPGNSVSWIHESLNNYMILRLAQWRNGGYPGQPTQFPFPSGIGYLDREVFNQPYVPIESCGINSSGEATAPGDYYNDSTGFRYNELFPLFVSQRVGMTFYPKVIESANTTEQNLQTMTRLLDKARVQSMVVEYAARLALGDFMEFSNAVQGVATTSMYSATTNQDGWLVPSDASKLPRYTGRNNIPISVSSGAASVTVYFAPDVQGSNGTAADMRCQIAYRATDGTTVFSTPVASGQTTIQLTKPPKNGVVIAVISNVTMSGYKRSTSYGWDPTERFGYKIQVTGGTAAPIDQLYF